jgi:Carbohydrate-selective porin, OprB family/S-layer homology domain
MRGVTMRKSFVEKSLLLSSILACSTGFATVSLADESASVTSLKGEAKSTSPYSTFQVVQTDEENVQQGQVTSVSQLSDVQPTDWAYQALQSLVERYGCIAGYPNGTFRGNRAATRHELAAALNACLDQISDRFATKEDLEAVKALQEEFKAELATLKGRTDSLEARASVLEAQQFSTTTKLLGEAIFQGVQVGGGNSPVPSKFPQGVLGRKGDNFTFSSRATLSLLTSFSGEDLLITSLQQGSFAFENKPVPDGTRVDTAVGGLSGLLSTQVAQASNTNISLFYLGYRFPFLKAKGTFYTTAVGGELSDFVDTLNPNLDSAGQGSISAFGLRNPIYRQLSALNTDPTETRLNGSSSSGTGAGFKFKFNDQLSLGVGYLAPSFFAGQSQRNPFLTTGGGLFGSDYAAIAQLTYKPLKNLGFGLTYVRSYTERPPNVAIGGRTGTIRANFPFGANPTSAHSAGLEFNWEASPRFALSGWAGVSFATAEAPGTIESPEARLGSAPDGANGTILNFALAATFPDLLGKGNMGALILGAEPSLISTSIGGYSDPDLPFHVEALYRLNINDFISITPGIIAVINPEGNSSNDPVIVGTVRTTFTF